MDSSDRTGADKRRLSPWNMITLCLRQVYFVEGTSRTWGIVLQWQNSSDRQ